MIRLKNGQQIIMTLERLCNRHGCILRIDDPAIRGNWIVLLNCLSRLFGSIADIAKIVIEKGT